MKKAILRKLLVLIFIVLAIVITIMEFSYSINAITYNGHWLEDNNVPIACIKTGSECYWGPSPNPDPN